jgi:hypothetical protein
MIVQHGLSLSKCGLLGQILGGIGRGQGERESQPLVKMIIPANSMYPDYLCIFLDLFILLVDYYIVHY